MSTDRFNRQFILIDFQDLENPEYLAFVRSPEFSTYLLMRRHIWRSRQPHFMALEALYEKGFLACSLDRERIAEQLGGVSIRTVTNDLSQLEQRGIIAVQHTGRQNIYLLGRWGEDDGARYETWYVDRLHVREEENFPSDGQSITSLSWEEGIFPSGGKKTAVSDVQLSAHINKERKREEKREEFENSKDTLKSISEARNVLSNYVEDFAREFKDDAPISSSITRTMNLFLASDVSIDDFISVLMAARQTTQRRTSTITKASDRPGPISTKNKMPYFFAVVSSLLGLTEGSDISPNIKSG